MQRRKTETQEEDEEIRKSLQTKSQTDEEDPGGEAREILDSSGGKTGGAEEKIDRVRLSNI